MVSADRWIKADRRGLCGWSLDRCAFTDSERLRKSFAKRTWSSKIEVVQVRTFKLEFVTYKSGSIQGKNGTSLSCRERNFMTEMFDESCIPLRTLSHSVSEFDPRTLSARWSLNDGLLSRVLKGRLVADLKQINNSKPYTNLSIVSAHLQQWP